MRAAFHFRGSHAGTRFLSPLSCRAMLPLLPLCSVPGGELGPTLKLRRNIVDKMYSTEIDAMYA